MGSKCTTCSKMFAVVSPNTGRCQRCINRANDKVLLAELYQAEADGTLDSVLVMPETTGETDVS